MRVRSTVNYIVIALAAVITAAVIFVPSVASEAVYPVENAGKTIGARFKYRLRGCMTGFAAAVENVRLKRELAALAMVRGDNERLEQENDRLRSALGYIRQHRGQWLAAEVLTRDGAAGVKPILRVDKGELDGVSVGAAVAVPEGLVGLVTEVAPHTAVVMPIVDASIKVDCEIELGGNALATGILSGGSEEMLLLKYLRHRDPIPPRSRVLTSGRGGVFPRGIEIGTFGGVRQDANDLLPEGEVLPGADFMTLEDVFIRCEK